MSTDLPPQALLCLQHASDLRDLAAREENPVSRRQLLSLSETYEWVYRLFLDANAETDRPTKA